MSIDNGMYTGAAATAFSRGGGEHWCSGCDSHYDDCECGRGGWAQDDYGNPDDEYDRCREEGW